MLLRILWIPLRLFCVSADTVMYGGSFAITRHWVSVRPVGLPD